MTTYINHDISKFLEKFIVELGKKIKKYQKLLIFLSIISIFAYGYELFNLNLTIDEEVASFLTQANTTWLSQGRWGMYLLNKILFPFTVIPFVPLMVALIFHIFSLILLVDIFEIENILDQFVVCSIGISYSGMAHIYTFSTFNYGVGIGLFSIVLSLFIFVNAVGMRKYWAIFPGAFAISIYQGFIPALISIYILYFIHIMIQNKAKITFILFQIIGINILAGAVYYLINKIILLSGQVQISGYVNQFFDLTYLKNNLKQVIINILSFIIDIFSGDKSIYGLEINMLKFLSILFVIGILIKIFRLKQHIFTKLLIIFMVLIFGFSPFFSGLITRGFFAMRFLVGLPFIFFGMSLLAFKERSTIFRAFFSLIMLFCNFQFISSTNHLFAAASLNLEGDRLLASRIINRIQLEMINSDSKNLKHIEVIGYPERSPSELIPKIETFGVSFFEWDQGNIWRIVYFLKTIGYDELSPVPIEQVVPIIKIGNTMSNWPSKDSVRIINDIVIIKFSDYSETQKASLCRFESINEKIDIEDFCN